MIWIPRPSTSTFGVSCASYWWTRISAAGIRATHHLLGPEFMLDLLHADDLESLGLGASGWKGILSYCYMNVVTRFPFKWFMLLTHASCRSHNFGTLHGPMNSAELSTVTAHADCTQVFRSHATSVSLQFSHPISNSWCQLYFTPAPPLCV